MNSVVTSAGQTAALEGEQAKPLADETVCPGTQCLLRFDDCCPTMNWGIWDRIEKILDRYRVRPILSVIPENKDPKLMIDSENPRFWHRVREWQDKGWIIGQHGYQHLYDSREPGLVPWWEQSEFAGHPFELQSQRIHAGIQHMKDEGVNPTVWVAPSHSFDRATLRALAAEHFQVVSDGMGYRPYSDEFGLVWIPAQPWKPVGPFSKTWTMIYHHNTLDRAERVETFVRRHQANLMGVGFQFGHLLGQARPKATSDALYEQLFRLAFATKRRIRALVRRR